MIKMQRFTSFVCYNSALYRGFINKSLCFIFVIRFHRSHIFLINGCIHAGFNSGNLSYVVHCAFRINEIVHLMLLDIVLCGIVVKHIDDIALIGEQQFTILVQNLNSLLRSIGLMQSGLRIVGQSVEYIKVEDQLVVVRISRELIERREIAFCEIIGNIVVHSLIRILRLLYIIIEFKGAVAGFGFCSDQG